MHARMKVSLDKAQDQVQGTQRYIAPERLKEDGGACSMSVCAYACV